DRQRHPHLRELGPGDGACPPGRAEQGRRRRRGMPRGLRGAPALRSGQAVTTPPKQRGSVRSAARLAAVQALYQMEMTGVAAAAALADVRLRDGAMSDDADTGVAVDEKMLKTIVEGVTERRDELDQRIAGHLAEGWSFDRLELVLRAILRAGAFEI